MPNSSFGCQISRHVFVMETGHKFHVCFAELILIQVVHSHVLIAMIPCHGTQMCSTVN